MKASEWPKTLRASVCADVKVGDRELRGCYGGAYTAHYRVDAIADGIAIMTHVIAESVRNEDGTFYTVWRDA